MVKQNAVIEPELPLPSESEIDIRTYTELVASCARDRLNYPIPNGDPTHARILITKLFETARQDVRLLSGMLTDRTTPGIDIYGHPDLIDNAKRFLRRPNSTLRIIIEKPIHLHMENRFLTGVVTDNARVGDIFLYFGQRLVDQLRIPHFLATDALAYRFELDDEKVKAVANFGDFRTAKRLFEVFDRLATFIGSRNMHRRFAPGAELQLLA